MQKSAYRTTTPFSDGGLSGVSDKTRAVPLFGDTPLIQDILNNTPTRYNDIHARGDWGAGEDVDKVYKQRVEDFRLDLRIQELMYSGNYGLPKENWTFKKHDGGTQQARSLWHALRTIRKDKLPYQSLVRRVAQVNLAEQSLNSCIQIQSYPQSSSSYEVGAGFCVSTNIYVTCAHVIQPFDNDAIPNNVPPTNVRVLAKRDAATVDAKILGIDFQLDIAVIECSLPSTPLQVVPSNLTNVGDKILTIGSPRGFENNVSSGIISSKDRHIFTYAGAPSFIFTDAQILPGSSGGPLIRESDSGVVGMVSLIVMGDSLYGLNAALPGDNIINFLKKHGVNQS